MSGRDSVCRPYCSLLDVPDGGTLPDLAMAPYCTFDMGICHPIAGYGSVCSFAKHLNRMDDLRVLRTTLEEEKQADKLLNELAESTINVRAAH